MGAIALVDASFLIALLSENDRHHPWAKASAEKFVTPWHTCESALSETLHIVGLPGRAGLALLLRRNAVFASFSFAANRDRVLVLMDKYVNVPMGLADACLVRMSELIDGAVVLTTDTDFLVYRRHGREVIPSAMPD